MAQGAVKKNAKSAGPASHKAKKMAAAANAGAHGAPKRGARVTKPPRTAKAKKSHGVTDKVLRQFSSGLIAKTEAMLGERAGHLELIGPGKKACGKPGPAAAAAKGGAKGGGTKPTVKSNQGGSRKYG